MVKISHFKHDHPPIILNEAPNKSDSRNITCYGCHKPLSWPEESAKEDVYGCATCGDFFVHDSCVELPKEIRYFLEERNSFLLQITLDPNTTSVYCYLCDDRTPVAPIYRSQLPSRNVLHIKCVFTEKEKERVVVLDNDLTLNHPSHKHDTLRLIPRLASIYCDANCESGDYDFSYLCSSCPFWIHRRCALIPTKTEWSGHNHPLTLSFGLPIEYHNYDYYCDLCDSYINTTDKTPIWLYCCYLCRYFVHRTCMNYRHFQWHKDYVSSPDKDLLQLPFADISMELIQPFFLGENVNAFANVESEIKLASHQQHPLILSEKLIFEHQEDDDEEILCDACIEPILSPPYYHCAKCRYFLHLHCANLPRKLEHSSHRYRHSLSLTLGSKNRFYDGFKCNLCGKYSNGCFFSCQDGESRFHMDIKCAALPSSIMHKSHRHRLHHSTSFSYREQVPELIRSYYRTCKGCHKDPEATNYFVCEYCAFYLHERCAMLPKTVRHRFDSHHPLRLRFPPHFYHPRPFDCAECETEIHPKHWLYHCEECDLSFHTYCVNRTGEFDNYKCGQKLELDIHPHPLKFVRKASVNSPCHRCGVDINQDLAFECETCNFHLCRGCVRTLNP